MNTQRRRLSWLLGPALGVLLALVISPKTNWLVRAQMAASGFSTRTPAAQTKDYEEEQRRLAARAPGDFQLQLAALPASATQPERVAYFRTLVPRFGNNPSLYANMLRYEVGSSENRTGVYLSRAEDWSLGSTPPPADYKIPPPPNSTALARFDSDAATGERLDPDNAFFPMMHAVGLFAAHRDTEGIEAVLRAGQKTAWREYAQDEINGRLRMGDAAYGHNTSLGGVAIVAAELYPQYGPLRGVARVAIAKAVLAELGGQKEPGMAIRRALMRNGDLMRVHSSVYIGSLVGIAISAIATARPGGAPVPKTADHQTGEERAQLRLRAFCAYAQRIGHPEDARRAQAEEEARKTVQAIFPRAEDRSALGGSQLIRLYAWWCADTLTLVNLLWLLLLGSAAAALSRLPRMRAGHPLLPATRWGIAAAFLTLLWFGSQVASSAPNMDWMATTLIWGGVLLAAVALACLFTPSAKRTELPQRLVRFALALGITVIILLALGGLADWQIQTSAQFPQQLAEMTEQPTSDENGSSILLAIQTVQIIALGLAVPLLMLIALSIAGRVRHISVSVALARGFKASAVPVACVLLIIYGVFVLVTVRLEQSMDDGLRQMVQHEGRYYASLAGLPWPGEVR